MENGQSASEGVFHPSHFAVVAASNNTRRTCGTGSPSCQVTEHLERHHTHYTTPASAIPLLAVDGQHCSQCPTHHDSAASSFPECSGLTATTRTS